MSESARPAGTIIFSIAWAPVVLQEYDGCRERKAAEPRPIPVNDAEQQEILAARRRS
jgi:hypothetical protein